MIAFFVLLVCLAAPIRTGNPAEGQEGRERAAKAAGEAIIGAIDLPGWVRSRQTRAVLPSLAHGSLDNLFDRDTATMAACSEEGPAQFDFYFRDPVTIHQVGITPMRGAAYRWSTWYAESITAGSEPTFAPLAGRQKARGGRRTLFRLGKGVRVQALRIIVERMTNGSRPELSEIEVYGDVRISGIRIAWPKEPLVAGGHYSVQVLGRDDRGGQTPLAEGVEWSLFPGNIVNITESGVLAAVSPGKVEAKLRFGRIEHDSGIITVKEPAPPPGSLVVTPFRTSARVEADFELPADAFLVLFRREAGQPDSSKQVHRTPAAFFNDFGLQPSTIYLYSAVIEDRYRNPITRPTGEFRIRTMSQKGPDLARAANLEVLTLFTDREESDRDPAALLQGIELGRTFFFRNSGGRLNIDLLNRPDIAFAVDDNPMIFYAIESRLLRLGLLDTNIGAIHVAGRNIDLNCGGARLRNGAALSWGATAQAPAPFSVGGSAAAACWTFVHEFQHSLDQVIDASRPDSSMLNGHFLDNYPLPPGEVFDAGDFYDGQAALLRRYDGFGSFPTPWNGWIEAFDRDGDGLPDSDPRWPVDELRLGTDPANPDTDGDGLNDLEEYCTGIYEGTNPLVPDTDGDGLDDKHDPFPLSDFSGRIPIKATGPRKLPPSRLSSGVSFRSGPDAPGDVTILACIEAGHLVFGFDSDAALRVIFHVDGSGHLGRFESDRRTNGEGGPASDIYTDEAAFMAAHGDGRLYKGTELLGSDLVESWESGGRFRMKVRIPAAAGPGTKRCHGREGAAASGGLSLEPGRILGLNFVVHPCTGSSGSWSAVYELHRFYDAVVVEER